MHVDNVELLMPEDADQPDQGDQIGKRCHPPSDRTGETNPSSITETCSPLRQQHGHPIPLLL
jgi:hypothetical protein